MLCAAALLMLAAWWAVATFQVLPHMSSQSPVGIGGLGAAERSARHGGGLLGAIGLIPLVVGGCMAIVNTSALAIAYFLDAR